MKLIISPPTPIIRQIAHCAPLSPLDRLETVILRMFYIWMAIHRSSSKLNQKSLDNRDKDNNEEEQVALVDAYLVL